MTFRYGYNNKKNEKCEGEIVASSKADVYAQLRKQGIKPYFVELKPGLLNKLQSFGKRGLAIVVLAVALVVTIAIILHSSLLTLNSDVSAQPRHQIYGDPAIMSDLANSDYATVFADPGERLLARYAQPGVIPANTENDWRVLTKATVENAVVISPDDSREVQELKRIVLWMKDELRQFLADGEDAATYSRRLVERLREEVGIYETAKRDLEKEKDERVWDEKNERLRRIGLRTIAKPKNGPKMVSPESVKYPIDG